MLLFLLLSVTDESVHDKIVYLVKKFHSVAIAFAKNRLYERNFPDYETEAEDVVSEVFLKIVLNIKNIDFSKSEKEIRSYVLTAVVNYINSLLRKNEIETESFDDKEISEQDFVNRILIREQYEKVVEAIKELDEKFRIPLTYLYFNEKSIKEIADLMAIGEKTVYKRIQRGREKILEILEKKSNKEATR